MRVGGDICIYIIIDLKEIINNMDEPKVKVNGVEYTIREALAILDEDDDDEFDEYDFDFMEDYDDE